MTFDSIKNAVGARTFQPSKPIREIRPVDLQRNPQIIGSRKYNGNFATAIVEKNGVAFFTASNLPLTTLHGSSHWAEVPRWMDTMSSLPPGTVLLGEIHIPSVHTENLSAFQEWYTWHANKLDGTANPPPLAATFKAFDVLSWSGHSTNQLPYRDRLPYIPELLRVELAPYTNLQEAAGAVETARAQQIEGFVFWDANAKTFCKLSGQNKARGGAWKVKPLYQEKFALLGFVNPDPAKLIAKLGNSAMEFNCGSGLTSKERTELVRNYNDGKGIVVTVGHYGNDEAGKPELPVMQAYELL